MKLRKSTKTWQRTRKPNLLRHKSGSYYARAFAGGKEVWQSLKTSHYSVAQAKLAEFLKEHRERVSDGNGEVSAKMTFGEALRIHQQNQADDVTLKSNPASFLPEQQNNGVEIRNFNAAVVVAMSHTIFNVSLGGG